MGGTFIKLPSDSSDSNTHHLLFPSFAELCKELITPPLIIVGSNFALANIPEISRQIINEDKWSVDQIAGIFETTIGMDLVNPSPPQE